MHCATLTRSAIDNWSTYLITYFKACNKNNLASTMNIRYNIGMISNLLRSDIFLRKRLFAFACSLLFGRAFLWFDSWMYYEFMYWLDQRQELFGEDRTARCRAKRSSKVTVRNSSFRMLSLTMPDATTATEQTPLENQRRKSS